MKQSLQKAVLLLGVLLFCGIPVLQAGDQEEPDVIEVENLAALRAQEVSATNVYRITGAVILTHQNGNRNQKYVQDETGAILIDDPAPSGSPAGTPGAITTTYRDYDAITGLTGRLSVFNQMLQFLPVADPGPPESSGNIVEPLVVAINEIEPIHQAMLIHIKEVSITHASHTNFAPSTSYTMTDASGQGVMRTPHANARLDYFGSTIPTDPIDITGVVGQFNQDMQLTPRSLADLQITDIPNIKALRNQNADNETVYTLQGEAFLSYQQSFRNKKWIQDETAGIEIDDNGGIITSSYNIGDGITGIRGKLNYNRQMLQFLPVEDPGEATSSDNELLVVERTLAELSSQDQSRLVLIKELLFEEALFGTNFATGRNLNVNDPSGDGVFRTEFWEADYIGTAIPTVAQNVTAIMRQFDASMQITARSLADFVAIGEIPTYSITFNIVDEDGDAVEDATVTLNEETFGAGVYTIEELLPGTYSYQIEAAGFHVMTGEVAVATEDVVAGVMLIAIDPGMVTEFPWHEGFEESFPPAGWLTFQLGDAGNWVTHATANTGSAAAHHNFTPTGQAADSWLVSPQIQLPEEEAMIMNFFERNSLMNDYAYSGVWISTGSGNPENEHYVQLYESDKAIGAYTQKEIKLGEYRGKVIRIAFVYRGADAHQWWIDDVKIEQAPDVFEVPNIAALREQGTFDGSLFRITGPIILTHQNGNRNQKYFQDETGAMLVDDPGTPTGSPGVITSEYKEYDAIVGLTGSLGVYNEMLQFTPSEDPGPPTSHDNVVEPILLTISEMKPEHQAMLIELKNVTISHATHTNFTGSTSYIINDATGEGILRTPHLNAGLDYFNTPIPETPKDITGVVVQFRQDIQIAPRSLADFKEPGTTSIANVEIPGLSVFPNPARDLLNLHSRESISQVRVIDLSGRVVLALEPDANETVIQTSGLQPGLYILQAVIADNIITRKFQITR